jgi:hypothetical protein
MMPPAVRARRSAEGQGYPRSEGGVAKQLTRKRAGVFAAMERGKSTLGLGSKRQLVNARRARS